VWFHAKQNQEDVFLRILDIWLQQPFKPLLLCSQAQASSAHQQRIVAFGSNNRAEPISIKRLSTAAKEAGHDW
jgi:hypothetical protein